MYKSHQPNLWSSKKGRFKDAHSRLIVNHPDPCSCGGQLRATCGQRLSDVSKYAHSAPPIPHHTSIPIIPIPTLNTFNTPTPPRTNTGHTSIRLPPIWRTKRWRLNSTASLSLTKFNSYISSRFQKWRQNTGMAQRPVDDKVPKTWWLPQYSRRCADEVTDCLGVYRCNQMFQHSIQGGLGQDHIEAPLRFPWEESGDHTRTLCPHPIASYNRRGAGWEWWQVLRVQKECRIPTPLSIFRFSIKGSPPLWKNHLPRRATYWGYPPLYFSGKDS